MNKDEIVVAVDLGSSKLAAMAAQKLPDGKLQILGVESELTPKDSIRLGVVRKRGIVAQKVAELLRKLENRIRLKVHIHTFYVGVNGHSLRTVKLRNGMLLGAAVEITDEILDNMEQDLIVRLKEKNIYTEDVLHQDSYELNGDLRIIYELFQQEFLLDDEIVENPVGETCEQMIGNYCVVVGRPDLMKNVDDFIQQSGFRSNKVISFQSMADAFLTKEEKELGCALIDFGAHCTTFSVYTKGFLRSMAVIPFGGSSITKDICDLKLLESDAEKLKIMYGNAIVDSEENKSSVKLSSGIEGLEDLIVSKKELAFIINARLEEILDLISGHLSKIEKNVLGAGLVITGGASRLKNLPIILQKKTGFRVRQVALANFLSENSSEFAIPEFALLIALLLNSSRSCCDKKENKAPIPKPKKNLFGAAKKFMDRIPDIFGEETPMEQNL